MIEFSTAPPQYSAADQADVRRLVRKADLLNVKKNEAIAFLDFIDTATNKVVRLTVASGAPVWTVL